MAERDPFLPESTPPLSVERLPLGALKLDPKNPRQHNDRQIGQIAQSIKRFKFSVPVLVDGDNRVLAGHGRILAAKKLGLREIPVIRLEWLTDAQARAFAIADNRLAEAATWDDRLLGDIFKELSALDLDFSLEDTGFSAAEIDVRIEALALLDEQPPSDLEEDVPPAMAGPAVSRVGDVWQLGRHRILCGDALEASSYMALMAGRRADMVFTDAPYNVPIDGHVSGKGAIRHREFVMASGEMTTGQFTHFLATVMQLLRWAPRPLLNTNTSSCWLR